jgi:hypothetical protein
MKKPKPYLEQLRDTLEKLDGKLTFPEVASMNAAVFNLSFWSVPPVTSNKHNSKSRMNDRDERDSDPKKDMK